MPVGYLIGLGQYVAEKEFFMDDLLVRIHFIIVMIRWTGLAPWEFKFPFPVTYIFNLLAPGELLATSEEIEGNMRPFRSRASIWRATILTLTLCMGV